MNRPRAALPALAAAALLALVACNKAGSAAAQDNAAPAGGLPNGRAIPSINETATPAKDHAAPAGGLPNGRAIPSINETATPNSERCPNGRPDIPPPGSTRIPGTKCFYRHPVENSPAKAF